MTDPRVPPRPDVPPRLRPGMQTDAGKAAGAVDAEGSGDAHAAQQAPREARRQARDAKRRLKDQRFDERQAAKRSGKDLTVLHGHHVIDTETLSNAFPTHDAGEENPVRYRHQLQHGIILVLLAALVVAALVLAALIYRGDLQLPVGNSVPTPKPHCPEKTFDYPPNTKVTVNVFNSTRTEGLAGRVSAELKKRGFVVKEIANRHTDYEGTAVLVSGTTGQAAAFNLQRNIPGTEYVQDDRSDATVDVYLTGSFKDLTAVRKVDQTPGQLSCPRFSPSPTAPAR